VPIYERNHNIIIQSRFKSQNHFQPSIMHHLILRIACVFLLKIVFTGARSSLQYSLKLRGGAGEHSFSLTTFSPEGRLEQLEHAMACIDESPPVVAMTGEGCIVLVAVEPDLGPLVTASGTPKFMLVSSSDDSGGPSIAEVGGGVGGCVVMAYSGMGADARVLAAKVQRRALQHSSTLAVPMPAGLVASALAEYMQEATQQGGTRPFGCAVLVAGFGEGFGGVAAEGAPSLSQVDPSGARLPVVATAIGRGSHALLRQLADRWRPGMNHHELEALGCGLLKDHASLGSREDGGTHHEKESEVSGHPIRASADDVQTQHQRSNQPHSTGRWQGTGRVLSAVLRYGFTTPTTRVLAC
jgi:20S proteasome subunit alpha 2